MEAGISCDETVRRDGTEQKSAGGGNTYKSASTLRTRLPEGAEFIDRHSPLF